MSEQVKSTNEPTAGQSETRECVATHNVFGQLSSLKYGCPGETFHTERPSTECHPNTCLHHDPVYEAEPSVPAASEPVGEWSGSYTCAYCHRDSGMYGHFDGVKFTCKKAAPTAASPAPVDPFAELDAAIEDMEQWAMATCEVRSKDELSPRATAVRAAFDRLRGSVSEPDVLPNPGCAAFFIESVPGETWVVMGACPEHKYLEGKPFTRDPGPIHPCRAGCVYERVEEPTMKPRKRFDDLVAQMSPESRERVNARAAEMLREMDAASQLTSGQRAWIEGKVGWEGMSISAVRAQYTIPIAEHLNEDGTARRCKDCRDDRAAWDHSTPEPDESEPSAPTGRDPDCAYCVRRHPDEICTCVPSVNSPFPSVDNSALAGEFDASVWAREFRRVNVACDEGTMLAWFATALMSGYDHATKKRDAEIATLRAAKEESKSEADHWMVACNARDRKLSEIAKELVCIREYGQERAARNAADRILAIIGEAKP